VRELVGIAHDEALKRKFLLRRFGKTLVFNAVFVQTVLAENNDAEITGKKFVQSIFNGADKPTLDDIFFKLEGVYKTSLLSPISTAWQSSNQVEIAVAVSSSPRSFSTLFQTSVAEFIGLHPFGTS
jgi:hypothetical protein